MTEFETETPLTAKPHGLMAMNILFVVMAMVFIVLGSLVQAWNFNLGILITEFGMLVLPAVLYMYFKKQSIIKQFRFKALPFKTGLLIVLAGLCFVPVVALANAAINLWLLYGLGMTPPEIPTQEGLLGPVISFVIVSLTPGFCEEFFFRGMMMTEYEKRMGKLAAGVLTAVLFGFFHFNFMNLFGPMALGIIFAYTVQVTESIWAGMLGHAVNNGFAVIMLYLTAGARDQDLSAQLAQVGDYWPIVVVFSLVSIAMFALPLAYLGFRLLKRIRRRHIKVGDQLLISGVTFNVLASEGLNLVLAPIKEDHVAKSLDLDERIETHYDRLKQNKRFQVINKHWSWEPSSFVFKISEWWPMVVFAVLYIGVAILSFSHLLSVTTAQ